MALPNPFQNTILPSTPVLSTTPKATLNDSSFFHGYRSNFNINQQKEQYQQRISQQSAQTAKFYRNPSLNFNKPEKIIAKTNSNSNNHHDNNWCNLCECNFKYPQQLQKHIDEHEKCWFDDCNFEGSSLLLHEHIEAKHQCVLFQRIAKIETDEDIEKWREERRKRYPTKANIEMRRLAQEERFKRGERIQEPNHRFGNIQNRKSAQQRSFTQNQDDSMKKDHGKKRIEKKRRRTRNKPNKNDIVDEKMMNCKDAQIATESVESKTVCNTSTTVEQCPVEGKEKTVLTTNALSAIMGMYGTDSDSGCDDDATTSMNNSVDTQVAEDKQDKQVNSITACVTAASEPISEVVESNEYTDVDETTENTSRKRAASTEDDSLTSIKQLKIDSSVHIKHIDQGPEIASDDDAPMEQPIQRQSNDAQHTREQASGPTDIGRRGTKKIHSKTLTMERNSKKKTILDMNRRIRSQNTLLEKLLQKDIRHERNILLQCVRYVVDNNFFGVGQKADEHNKHIENA